MADMEKAINEIQWFLIARPVVSSEERYDQFCEGLHDALELLTELDKLLCKKQKNIDKLQADYSMLRHKFLEKTQIVRCKDCKHRGNADKCVIAAIAKEKDYPIFMLDNRGEWYCADGEAKQ